MHICRLDCQLAMYLGTGVDSDFIKQIRNEFLDMRLRREIIHQGEWETRSSYLEHIEMIFNEPSESSFGTTLNEFFTSLNELNKNPGI